MAIDAYCMHDGSHSSVVMDTRVTPNFTENPMMVHGNIGALANHSRDANARLSMFSEGARPCIFLIATMPISIGEEILWDYDDRRPGVDAFLKK
jgi:hypothetical protein